MRRGGHAFRLNRDSSCQLCNLWLLDLLSKALIVMVVDIKCSVQCSIEYPSLQRHPSDV